MEGIIPFIFKAIAQYREEGQVSFDGVISDEASYYVLLPGDSDDGYHEETNRQLRRPASAQAEAVATFTSSQEVPLRGSTLRRQTQARRPWCGQRAE
jgi:hypothetical protein